MDIIWGRGYIYFLLDQVWTRLFFLCANTFKKWNWKKGVVFTSTLLLNIIILIPNFHLYCAVNIICVKTVWIKVFLNSFQHSVLIRLIFKLLTVSWLSKEINIPLSSMNDLILETYWCMILYDIVVLGKTACDIRRKGFSILN